MTRHTLALTAALAVLAASAPARADIVIGAGVSGNFNVGGGPVELPTSWSLSGVAGYRLGLGALEVTPELELIYLGALNSLNDEHVDWAFQTMAGARAGLDLGGWVPSVFVHAGLGNLRLNEGDLGRTDTGPSVEVGAAVDWRLADAFSLGVQASYTTVSVEQIDVAEDVASVKWIRAGAYAKLSF